jgi:1-acyl-sn-glycerol-3-phosphate acyltransferase
LLALRSLLFNLLFFGWTAILCILGLPFLALPRSCLVLLARFWVGGIRLFLRLAVGISDERRGTEHRVSPAIYAFKHQSAWETLMLVLLLRDPAIILKRELLYLPIFGLYLMKTLQIAVDRGGGAKALRGLLRQARAAAEADRPIVIFPEGTRVAPGERRPYQPGVAALYSKLGLPVIPVALNSGVRWRRRGFLKRPGRIIVEFLPPIAPGLPREAFLAALAERLEPACARLLAEGENRPWG